MLLSFEELNQIMDTPRATLYRHVQNLVERGVVSKKIPTTGAANNICRFQFLKFHFDISVLLMQTVQHNDLRALTPVFFFYVCFVAVWIELTDINNVLFSATEELWRSFLFLPHAVRVLSAVYLGWAAYPDCS